MVFNIKEQKEDVITKAVFRTTKKTPTELSIEKSKQVIKDLEEIGVFA